MYVTDSPVAIRITSFGISKATRMLAGYPCAARALGDSETSPNTLAEILRREYASLHPGTQAQEVEDFIIQIMTALQATS